MFLPGEPDREACYFLPRSGEDFCMGLEKDHLVDREGTVRPHPCHVPDLAGQGGTSVSNPQCQLKVCRAYRLAKVHDGFKPVLVEPEEERGPKEAPIPRMLFANQKPLTIEDTIPAVAAWDAYSAQVRDLIVRKSQGYGDAWRRQGYMGNLARVLSKAARLENLAWNDLTNEVAKAIGSESIEDTLRDLGALCAFTLDNIEEGNRWGR